MAMNKKDQRKERKGDKMAKKSTSLKANKGSPSMRQRSEKPAQEKGSNIGISRRQKVQGKGSAAGSVGNVGTLAKKGCLTTMFMLLLPFIAIGTLLLLRS
jgi:hypothetical protein